MAENEWTEELKQKVVESYLEKDPTPDTTMDIVKEVAEEFGKTPNGVRMILTKAEVYVKKEAGSSNKGGSKSTSSTGAKRVNKAEAIDALKDAITASGKVVDEDICDRLTGKAAVYFTGLLSK